MNNKNLSIRILLALFILGLILAVGQFRISNKLINHSTSYVPLIEDLHNTSSEGKWGHQRTFLETDNFFNNFKITDLNSTSLAIKISTFIGGDGNEYLNNMQIDSNGNIYLSGSTYSSDFPTKNAFNSTYGGGEDSFLTKFASNGTLLFSTFIGGSNTDWIKYMTLDSDANIILAGQTTSSDFPAKNAFDSTYGGNTDTFLTEFASNGTILFSTFIGGDGNEYLNNMQIDSNGNIYLSGSTYSSNFPTKNAFNSTYGGGEDSFLTKFASNGTLLFSTYIGGTSSDSTTQMLADSLGNIYLSGATYSSDFPILNAIDPIYGGSQDGFLIKISENGSILFSTYLGGSANDWIASMQLDSMNNICLGGTTRSPDIPKKNAFHGYGGGNEDGFLTKIAPNGSLLFSTYIGGGWGGDDYVNHIMIDIAGDIYVSGKTYSWDFLLKNAFDSNYNQGPEAFLVKVASNGSLIFSTYVGGSGYHDEIRSMSIDSLGNIILSGKTDSLDFPIKNAFDTTYGGGDDIFLAKVATNGSLLFCTYIGGSRYENFYNMQVDSNGNIYLSVFTSSTDFPTKDPFINTYGGGEDSFLTKFDTNGSLLFSTLIGGSASDNIRSMSIDSEGNIYLSGQTSSADFPTFNTTFGGKTDNFFMKISDFRDIDIDGMDDDWEAFFGLNKTFDDSLTDFDSDGMPNIYEYEMLLNPNINDSFGDKDHDGMPNLWEFQMGLLAGVNDGAEDLDGDGMPNLWEFQMNLNASNALDGTIDVDGDGLSNYVEFTIKTSAQLFDTDGDGIDDGSELPLGLDPTINDSLGDRDHDGMPNLWEYQMGLQVNLNDAQEDYDHDGMPNLWEYQMALQANLNDAQEDYDHDGMPNLWEFQMGLLATLNDAFGDNDHDGMPNLWEYQMNLNASIDDASGDNDHDGMTNLWEYQMNLNASIDDAFGDNDHDGMPNLWEYQMNLNPSIDDASGDNDHDGMPNLWEYQMGLNASNVQDGKSDLDGDGLSNYVEFSLKSSPLLLDTDNDGIDDGYEYQFGFNLLVPDSQLDADGDWITNLEEYHVGTNPYNIFSFPFLSINIIYVSILVIILFIVLSYIMLWIISFIIKFKKKIKAPTFKVTYFIWKGNFKDYSEFQVARLKGASSVNEYQLVTQYHAPNFKIACDMQKGEFTEYEQYINAKSLGASTLEEYKLVLKYHAPDYETAYSIELGGFPSYELYEQARNQGVLTFENYLNMK